MFLKRSYQALLFTMTRVVTEQGGAKETFQLGEKFRI